MDSLLKEVGDIPVVVEMRNVDWQNEQVYTALRQRNVGWCITDSPLGVSEILGVPDIGDVRHITSDIAYMRFHGRNSEMWYRGDNVSRYDYLYSDSELQAFGNL